MAQVEAEWQRVANRGEPSEGLTRYIEVRQGQALLVRRGGKLFAAQANCGHMRFPLADGKIDGTVLTCPLHKAQFDLSTDAVVRKARVPGLIAYTKMGRGILSVPTEPLKVYDVDERNDGVYVRSRS
ncbi:MAG: Rieske 2Fe-2S domain-containing protein [Thermoplasmata archaeon]